MLPPSSETSVPDTTVSPRAEAVIDLDAISANVTALHDHVGGRDVMAIVKADGYGHGLVQSAWAARAGGASWLGVALLEEALQLRAAGETGPILSWLAVPGERFDAAAAAGVEVSAYSVRQLDEIVAATEWSGARIGVQLKLDSGLNRGGAQVDDWSAVVEHAAKLQAAGQLAVTGVWSHLACSDEPDHPSNGLQVAAFAAGLAEARAAGLEPRHIHLANSGALLTRPDSWHTMVRPGIAVYGLSPFRGGESPVALRPAMTLQATVALTKRVAAGHSVSYGHTYTTDHETTLALVPLGYGDGVPWHASNCGPVSVRGVRHQVAGRMCMDQFVIDADDSPIERGDAVVLFGPGDDDEPTANDWAEAAGTINYEIVTRVGARVPRRYVGGGQTR